MTSSGRSRAVRLAGQRDGNRVLLALFGKPALFIAWVAELGLRHPFLQQVHGVLATTGRMI